MQAQYGHKKKNENATTTTWLVLLAVLFWTAGVFFWFSGRVGALYGYTPELGSPLVLGSLVGYDPLAVWAWPEMIWSVPAVEQLMQRGLMILAGPPVLLLFLGMAGGFGQKAIKDLHGSAYWAGKKEIRDMGYLDGQGVYVGGFWDTGRKRQLYLRHNGPEHILCFAPTRSGKGVGLILPTLVSWPDSSVVLDIKGENYALTSGWLASQGNRVLRFDPADASGASARFNPLEEIRLETERGIADVQQIVSMVLDPDGKGLEDYWNKAAFGFFGGVMLHCLIMTHSKEQRRASMYDVSVMLEDPKRTGGPKELFQEIIDTDHAAHLKEMYPEMSHELADAMHIFCASAASGMLAKADKEMAGVVSTATANLGLYRDPVVARNISASDFRIADLMNQDAAINLYLVVSPADIDRLRPLLRIFTNQLLGRLTEKLEFGAGGTKISYQHRLLLMLDEFTGLGKLAIIERAIAFMAGYGIKGYFIVQDTKQLNGTYGQDNALMANCHIRIAFAPNLPETAEYLSKLTGTTTVVQRKKSISRGKGGGSTSISIQETARPLLTPDECLRLPGIRQVRGGWQQESRIEPGDMLIFTAGHAPIYGRQILHFLDPVFLARTSMPPAGQANIQKEKDQPAPVPEESAGQAYLRYLDDLPEGIER
ncbi:MAG: type IV secretory system conjugative DNA transfer family protein [Desulfobulbus sp.]|jgi:type IV secretion system protein VirD4